MTIVAYDHQIFSAQRAGGISRYFCELAQRIPLSPGWYSRIVAPLHYNDHLAESAAARWGLHVPAKRGKGRLHRGVNAVLGPMVLGMVGADVVHRTYYADRPHPRRSALVVTVFDMIHELFPQAFPQNDRTRWRKRRSVMEADHVICISQSTARDLVRILDVPREKITVTYLGISDHFLAAANAATRPCADRPYLLYVGNRSGYKNFRRVLEAYGASPRLAAFFDLVAFGGEPWTDSEISRIEQLELRPRSVRRIQGGDAELKAAYAGAHLFVYPSEYEGFGIAPAEAMSLGCPVACSNTSSIPEVVGKAGEYFDPTDVGEIRASLERASFDETRRREMVSEGRRQSVGLSWDRCAAETLAVYRRVVGV